MDSLPDKMWVDWGLPEERLLLWCGVVWCGVVWCGVVCEDLEMIWSVENAVMRVT